MKFQIIFNIFIIFYFSFLFSLCSWNKLIIEFSSPIISLSIGGKGKYTAIILNNNNNIYISNDYLNTWKSFTTIQEFSYSSNIIISGNGKYILASDINNILYISYNYGENFTDISNKLPLASQPKDIAINYDGSIIYLLVGSEVYKSIDYGESWLFLIKTQTSTQAIATDSTGIEVRVSAYWSLLSSSDSGNTWIKSINNVDNEYDGFTDITTNGKFSYTCTSFEYQDGTNPPNEIFLSDDQGISYSPLYQTNTVWDNIGMSSNGEIVLSSTLDSNYQYATYYLSNDNGKTWSETITTLVNPNAFDTPYNALAVDSDGYSALIGSYTSLYLGKCT